MASRAEWDRRFMQKALLLASFSKDPSTKVGACIASFDNRGVSEGYNGPPRGVIDDPARLADRDLRLAITLHAEVNAILFARRDLTGCTLYSTFIPCSNCAALIIQTGIARVVAPEPPAEFAKRWARSIEIARMMFDEARVTLDIMEHMPCL